MALILKDRVKQQTTTTGDSNPYTLSGSFTGFDAFTEIGDGNETYYCCTDGTDFEIGRGTFTASGTTLSRAEILSSSNSDAAVNWTSGTRTIFCTQPADKAVLMDASGNISIPGTIDGRDLQTDGGKLDGIENNADVTDTANVTAAGALMDSEVTNLSQVKAFASSDYATAAQGSTADAALPKAGGQMTGNITFSGSQTVDGRDVSADGAKLDGIEASATADQTKSDIDALNIDAATLDGIDSASFLRSDAADSFSGTLTGTGAVTTSTYLESGRGSGGVSLTINDGYGNANIAFNHRSGTPEQNGQAGRIHVNTDNTGTNNAQMQFQLGAATADTGAALTEIMRLKETSIELKQNTNVTGNITVTGTVDGRDVGTDGTKLDGIEASADVTDATNVTAAGAAMLTGATFTGDVTLLSTTAGSGDDPSLILKRDATAGDWYNIGNIDFVGENDASEATTYVSISGMTDDVSDGTEDGRIRFSVITNGSSVDSIDITGSSLQFRNEQQIIWVNQNGSYYTYLAGGTPTAYRTITLPDATGTVLTTGNSDEPTTTTSSSDADFVLVDDGGTMKKITPANLGIGAGSFLPLSGGTLTGALTSRVADDLVLTVHSDTTTTPTAALALQRGTNDTYGADAYTDYKLENGYGSTGSIGGTLSITRKVDGNAASFLADFNTDIYLLQDVTFSKAIVEKAYECTGTALDPSNGTIQHKTLTGNTTFTTTIADGESITLMIDDGSSYTVTWPTMTWASGSAPTLATSGYTTVVIWRVMDAGISGNVGSQIFGAVVS